MSLLPRWFQRQLPQRKDLTTSFNYPSLFEKGIEKWPAFFEDNRRHSGLDVSSDTKNIYVEAHVPGLTNKDIEVSLDQDGLLCIHGIKKEEKSDRKCFRKSQREFSYYLSLGHEVDLACEPKAVCKEGVMKLTFAKCKGKQKLSKRIDVKCG